MVLCLVKVLNSKAHLEQAFDYTFVLFLNGAELGWHFMTLVHDVVLHVKIL